MKYLEKAVREEVMLTHSSQIIQEAAICYCIAIRALLNKVGDRQNAYKQAK